eukprot:CAMPEP_0172361380 /NCGR_PEP_ID=MMETSP1060-20121228/5230_1 /TAXON_ID=37318 /ORGANISM="Pseudo-nitzschia pungens, Strain cf. cingulata" /LENGTH=79 /DNA_ID=CAMNT_0013083621 /DNA_START=320 /DNA_END=556 /DNA_ORIENTATION=-
MVELSDEELSSSWSKKEGEGIFAPEVNFPAKKKGSVKRSLDTRVALDKKNGLTGCVATRFGQPPWSGVEEGAVNKKNEE